MPCVWPVNLSGLTTTFTLDCVIASLASQIKAIHADMKAGLISFTVDGEYDDFL